MQSYGAGRLRLFRLQHIYAQVALNPQPSQNLSQDTLYNNSGNRFARCTERSFNVLMRPQKAEYSSHKQDECVGTRG
jgi:hypothetical protein